MSTTTKRLIAEFRKKIHGKNLYLRSDALFPGRWGHQWGDHSRYDIIPLIHQVVADTKATDIDLYDPFVEHKDMFPDTVHPNDAGAQIMSSVIYTALTGNKPRNRP